MKLTPRDLVVGPLIAGLIVYLTASRSLRHETLWELVAYFVGGTLIYYIGRAVTRLVVSKRCR